MKKPTKRIAPAALATTLAFGVPHAVSAIELNEANENYAGVLDWTEEEWNNRLGELVGEGTTLDDFDSVEELETAIGPIVNVDEIANGDLSDKNILELLEKYKLTTEDLAAFLESYDDRENIHFIGDLENALLDEEIIDPINTEEGTPETRADTLDMEQVEANYLTQLGWTEKEFNNYLINEYDRGLTDFTNYNELQATVGPVLTDTALEKLLAENGLTQADFDAYLAENKLTRDDFLFVNDVEPILAKIPATIVTTTEEGAAMPDTATDSIENMLWGTGAILLGAVALFVARRKGEQ